MKRLLKWNFQRRFGLEYEFSNRGSDLSRMAQVVREATDQDVESRCYEHTRGNYHSWVCKTDSSCGTEVVSPILRGPTSLKKAAEILPVLQDNEFGISNDCGQHVHVEIADYTQEQAGILAAYWMKIERFIINGTPGHRRRNRYCRPLTDINASITPNLEYSPENAFRLVAGRNAINFQNFRPGRGTIEFRFGEMTYDPEVIKNRVRFLIWLIEMCKVLPPPKNLNWFTPKQVLTMFNLMNSPKNIVQYTYSPAVQSMRKWLIKRLIDHAPDSFQKDIDMCRTMLEEMENESEAESNQSEDLE